MKKGWEYKKLPEISENLDCLRKPVTKKNRTSGIYPYYGASGIVDYVDDFLFNEDLLCISEDGANLLMRTYPIAFSISGKVWVNNHAHVLRFKNMATQKYVEYFFSGLKLDEYITGAAQPKLTQKALNNIIIHIPISIDEQQRIVSYLDAAFAKIDAMKANAENALKEAKALFQASLKEMMLPKPGWEEKKLGDIAIDMYRGSGVKREQITEDGMSCVRYGEIYTKYNYHFNKCISHTLIEYINSPKYFEYGDILFAITGESVEEIGKNIAYTGNDKCLAGGDIVVMKHNFEPRYISYALSTPSAVKQKGHGKTKLKVVHTNIPSLKEIIIPIAPKNEQIKIADTLDAIKSRVDRLQSNFDTISRECDALKQAILREVFEGE